MKRPLHPLSDIHILVEICWVAEVSKPILARHVFVRGLFLGDLMPMLQAWLSNNNYDIHIVANRIDATKNQSTVKLLFDDYTRGCIVRLLGRTEDVEGIIAHISKISMFENGLVVCDFCGAAIPPKTAECPKCGAPHQRFRSPH